MLSQYYSDKTLILLDLPPTYITEVTQFLLSSNYDLYNTFLYRLTSPELEINCTSPYVSSHALSKKVSFNQDYVSKHRAQEFLKWRLMELLKLISERNINSIPFIMLSSQLLFTDTTREITIMVPGFSNFPFQCIDRDVYHWSDQGVLKQDIWLQSVHRIEMSRIVNTDFTKFIWALATSNDTRAQVMLGLMHLLGIGMRKNREEALAWYYRAWIRGQQAAAFALSIWKYEHEGTHPDFSYSTLLILEILNKKGPGWYLHLGIAYWEGSTVQRNLKRSFYYLQKASRTGDPLSKCKLGWMYEHGIGIRQDFGKAKALYKAASSRGIGLAYILHGDLHMYGRGVRKNYRHALHCYERGARVGCIGALCAIADVYRQNDLPDSIDNADALYRIIAERGYEIGWVKLADMWKEADNITREMESAIISYYIIACLAGNPEALVQFGVMCRSGYFKYKNLEAARRLFIRGEERGSCKAMALLGSMYDSGLGVVQDTRKAELHYRSGMLSGDSLSYISLADLLMRDQRSKERRLEAKKLLRRSFAFGNTVIKCESLCRLGRLYEEGRGIRRNSHRAFSLYAECERYADCDGKSEARYRLGCMFEKGIGTDIDLTMAMAMYEGAGDAANGRAYLRLGEMHQHGIGTRKCVDEAIVWYERAFLAGSLDGAYRLARIYERTDVHLRDIHYAASLYLTAATEGHSKSQYRLALLELYGKDIQKDLVDAYHWLAQAATQGHRRAALLLEELGLVRFNL